LNLYAESSAIAAWLLDEPAGDAVRDLLGKGEVIFASDLTLVECERVLIRAAATGTLPEADAARRRARLTSAAAHWNLLKLDDETVERARRPFPHEPIRTLDALHVASALVVRSAVGSLALLSLDERVRSNGERLGFEIVPG